MVLLSSAAADNRPSPAADLIKDTTTASFTADVLEASLAAPVIVDFWAPWCGPCKQLTPVLEKIVRAAQGAVRMVKLNIDAESQIAQQMRIQSVPAVFAFFQGRPVDGFMGALPESQVKQWVERLIKLAAGQDGGNPLAELDAAFKQADDLLTAGDHATAQAIYADILGIDPANARAYAGVVRTYLAAGDAARAQQLFQTAPAELQKDKAFDPVRALLELAAQAASAGSVADLQAKMQKDPKDFQARYDLSLALLAQGQKEAAIDQLLELVRLNRQWNEEAARKQLVKLFDAFGPADPLTISARKRLSSILFS